MIGCLTQIISLGTAVSAGIGYINFWWTLIPAFFAGALALSNGPHFNAVVEANKRGNFWLFPANLVIYVGSVLVGCGIAFGVTRWIVGQ